MTPTGCVILTGAPGAGKTTVLSALKNDGYRVVDESARAIIRERLIQGLPSRPAAREFAMEIMRRDIANYLRTMRGTGWIFFDRGVPDGICMLHQAAPLAHRKVAALLGRFAYHRQVFIFPPWKDIYRNDAERDQSFADAVRVFEALGDWYRGSGYEVVEMPLASVEARCRFVLQTLGMARSTT